VLLAEDGENLHVDALTDDVHVNPTVLADLARGVLG